MSDEELGMPEPGNSRVENDHGAQRAEAQQPEMQTSLDQTAVGSPFQPGNGQTAQQPVWPSQPEGQTAGPFQPGAGVPASPFQAGQPMGAQPGYPNAGTQGGYAMPAPRAKKPLNVVGLISMILGILTFVLALIPGVIIFVWPMGLVALVLAIVGLVLKDKGKGMAIAGLALSVLAGIAGLLITVVAAEKGLFDSFLEADETNTVTSDVDPSTDLSWNYDEDESVDEDDDYDYYDVTTGKTVFREVPEGEPGSYSNPLNIGDEIVGDGWTVKIDSYVKDATALIVAEGNPEPPAGTQWSLAEASAVRKDEDPGYPLTVFILYFSSDDELGSPLDAEGVLPPGTQFGFDRAAKGETSSGYEVLRTPVGDDGLLAVLTGFDGTLYFVKTS